MYFFEGAIFKIFFWNILFEEAIFLLKSLEMYFFREQF